MAAHQRQAHSAADAVLILYSSGLKPYREYVVRSAARVRPLWLFGEAEPTWERDYLAGWTVVDTLSVTAARHAAAELAALRRIAGLLCYDEFRLQPAAEVAVSLGVPTSPPEAVTACRDKRRTRELLAAAGVAQPRSICVADLDQAERAAEDIGYPVVVKPRGLAASEGVGVVGDPSELTSKVDAALRADFAEVPRFREGLLVEEYLDGPEISVDCVVCRGMVTPLYLARKELDWPGTFEETGHVVSADDPLLTDPEILALLTQAHTAIGFDHGLTHTEIRLTKAGPRVVEVNGRLGGDFIPYVGGLATGIDAGTMAATVAIGEEPELTPRRPATAAVRFLYPDRDIRLTAIDIDLKALPPGVMLIQPLAEPGQELRLPPRAFVSGRAAAAFAYGPTATACQEAFADVWKAITIKGDDLE